MMLPYKQVKDLMYFLAMKEQPLADPVGFSHKQDDVIETMTWDSDEERVTLQEFKGKDISLYIDHHGVGCVFVTWKAKGDEMYLNRLSIDIYDATKAKELWFSFQFISNTLHDEFGFNKDDIYG